MLIYCASEIGGYSHAWIAERYGLTAKHVSVIVHRERVRQARESQKQWKKKNASSPILPIKHSPEIMEVLHTDLSFTEKLQALGL